MSIGQELRSVGFAAKRFQVSTGTVRNWIAKGYVKAVSLPSGVRRIPDSEINRLLSEMFSLPAPFETALDEVEVEIEDRPIEFVGAAAHPESGR